MRPAAQIVICWQEQAAKAGVLQFCSKLATFPKANAVGNDNSWGKETDRNKPKKQIETR